MKIIELLRICDYFMILVTPSFSHVSERAPNIHHETVTKNIIKDSSITDILNEKLIQN